jgi:hypothetical protein
MKTHSSRKKDELWKIVYMVLVLEMRWLNRSRFFVIYYRLGEDQSKSPDNIPKVSDKDFIYFLVDHHTEMIYGLVREIVKVETCVIS